MTLQIGNYKVKISAENLTRPKECRNTSEDTQNFLNILSLAYSHAARNVKYDPDMTAAYAALMEHDYYRNSEQIYQHLKQRGFYDDLHKED